MVWSVSASLHLRIRLRLLSGRWSSRCIRAEIRDEWTSRCGSCAALVFDPVVYAYGRRRARRYVPHDQVSPAGAKEWDVSLFFTLDRSDLWAKFRPTKVSLHGVSAAVAFGDAGLALEAARPSCDGIFAPFQSDGLLSGARGHALTASRAGSTRGTGRSALPRVARRRTFTARPAGHEAFLYVVVCGSGIAGDVG